MNNIILFGFAFTLVTHIVRAQDEAKIDSLNYAYRIATTDTTKALILIDISNEYKEINPDTSIQLCEKALALSKKNNYLKGKEQSTWRLASTHEKQKDMKKALDYYQENLSINEQLKDMINMRYTLKALGRIYRKQENYLLSLNYFKKSLNISKSLDDKRDIAYTSVMIGMNYRQLSKAIEAVNSLQEGLKAYEELENKDGIASTTMNIGNVYLDQKDYNIALGYYEKSLQLHQQLGDKHGVAIALNNLSLIYKHKKDYNKSLNLFHQSLKISEETGNRRMIGTTVYNIGNVYQNQQEYDLALKQYKRSLEIQKESDYKYGQANCMAQMAQVFKKKREYEKSLFYAEKSLEIAKEIENLIQVRASQTTLYEIYKGKEDYVNALKYYELAQITRDSLFNVDKSKAIANLEATAEVERKSKEITILNKNKELLEKDNELQKLEAERQRNAKLALKKQAEADRSLGLAQREQSLRKQDSLQTLARQKQLEAENLKVKEEQLEAENRVRTLEVLKEREAKEFQQYINVFILAGALVLLTFAYFIYRSRQKEVKIKEQLKLKQKEINLQNHQLKELNTLKDRIFSIIAHDLRSPINSLHGLLLLFEVKHDLTQEEMNKQISRVAKNMGSVSGLLNNLLYWAQSQMKGMSFNPVFLELKQYFQEGLQLFHEITQSKGIQTFIELNDDVPNAHADAEILRFLMRNLLNNAFKFSRENGKVIISAIQDNNSYVKIMVKDEGVGMNDATKQALFKDFVRSQKGTRSEKGTGLGLMLCKEFVEKSGGKIGVESTFGSGSTFWFTLPVAPNSA